MKTKVYFPGPTAVRENVRNMRAVETTNPDMDPAFYALYGQLGKDIGRIFGTDDKVLVLSGEGILGLEAACASLTEKGDRVLVLDNGIFGEGFADFVRMYGGSPVLFSGDRRNAIDPEALEEFLEKDHDFKYATLVHCDTPSGVLNPLDRICPLLKRYGILTVVDAVSSSGGEPVDAKRNGIDICLGASQKAFSAPVGLTFLSVSEGAFEAMEKRETSIAGYYVNLLSFRHGVENQWFPYTMPVSDILGLRQAVDNILEEGILAFQERHRIIGEAVRQAVLASGLHLHLESGFSNTVTAVEIPAGFSIESLIDHMHREKGLLLSGSIGYLKNKVLRIGHMGENAKVEEVASVLKILEEALAHFEVPMEAGLRGHFLQGVGRMEKDLP
jgi:aspartate aminotransferase-like enzyme